MQKLRLNSKLIVMIIAVLLIAVFAFAGCSNDDDKKKETEGENQDVVAVKYEGPIKNINEMIEYAPKTVYDNLTKEFDIRLKQLKLMMDVVPTKPYNGYWTINYTDDGKITSAVFQIVQATADGKYIHFYNALDFNTPITYGDLLVSNFGANYNTSFDSTDFDTDTVANNNARLALGKKIALDYKIAEKDILYVKYAGAEPYEEAKESLNSSAEPTTVPYRNVKYYVCTPYNIYMLNVKVASTTESTADHMSDAVYDDVLAKYTAGEHGEINKMDVVDHIGKACFRSTDVDKEYPQA